MLCTTEVDVSNGNNAAQRKERQQKWRVPLLLEAGKLHKEHHAAADSKQGREWQV